MARKDTRRAVALIYATAGVPFGIIGEVLPLLLFSLHMPAKRIGLIFLVQLAWVAKLLWAPWVDRHATLGAWLEAAMLGLSICFVAMAAAAHTGHAPMVVLAACGLSLCAATLDLSADAAMVRLLRAGQVPEASANSLRIGSFKLGLTVGGGLCIALSDVCGWGLPLCVCAGIALVGRRQAIPLTQGLPSLPPMAMAAWQQGLLAWLRVPRTQWLVAFVFAYKLSLTMAAPMSKLFWTQLGVKMSSVGLAMASCGLVGATCGAALAAAGVMRMGLSKTLLVGSVCELGVCALQATFAANAAASPSAKWFFVVAFAESLTQGLTTTALAALIARKSSGAWAATQSGVLTASFALTRAVGGAVGGSLFASLPPTQFFILAGMASLPAWALLAQAKPEESAAQPR